jgi:hypothetical protein
MKSHEDFEDLAAVYVVGALDGDDLTRFEVHRPKAVSSARRSCSNPARRS